MQQACNYIKKETLAQMFTCEFCEISKNAFSYKTPPVAASVGEETGRIICYYLPFTFFFFHCFQKVLLHEQHFSEGYNCSEVVARGRSLNRCS